MGPLISDGKGVLAAGNQIDPSELNMILPLATLGQLGCARPSPPFWQICPFSEVGKGCRVRLPAWCILLFRGGCEPASNLPRFEDHVAFQLHWI